MCATRFFSEAVYLRKRRLASMGMLLSITVSMSLRSRLGVVVAISFGRVMTAMLAFMIVHLTFPAAVLVPATAGYQRFVLLSVHLR